MVSDPKITIHANLSVRFLELTVKTKSRDLTTLMEIFRVRFGMGMQPQHGCAELVADLSHREPVNFNEHLMNEFFKTICLNLFCGDVFVRNPD